MNAFVAQALRESERRRAAEDAVPRALPRTLSVDELAAAAAAGDVEAVGRLYDALVGSVYRYVMLRVHRREDAEDIDDQDSRTPKLTCHDRERDLRVARDRCRV